MFNLHRSVFVKQKGETWKLKSIFQVELPNICKFLDHLDNKLSPFSDPYMFKTFTFKFY